MKILIIGASQGTGAHLARLALERGHQVTAFSRNPYSLGIQHSGLRLRSGSMHDIAAVQAAVPGHEAVVITASSRRLQDFRNQPDFFSLGTQLVIDAMHSNGVRRLSVQSAFGVGDSLPLMNFAGQLFVRWFLTIPFADHERQEQIVRASSLDWTIVRPMRLTDGRARGRFKRETGPTRLPLSISRADVAAFHLEALETDQWLGKTVHIGG